MSHQIAPAGRPLCPLNTCTGCDAERFARYDEKLQRGTPGDEHLTAMRHEFGPPEWLDESMLDRGFVLVDVVAGSEP